MSDTWFSDRTISNAEVVRIAAEAAGVRPPRVTIPLAALRAGAALGTVKGRLLGSDDKLSLKVDWTPTPVEESIREAARWWIAQRKRPSTLR